jgi:group I intron endonuclease
MKSGIYKITNTENGKFYIGSAKNFDKRWYDHKRDLTLNIHKNPKLQHSWKFHGEDKFLFTILEEVEPDQVKLFEREQYYLDTLKPYERNIGYNICPVAEGGDNITHNPNRDAFIEKMKIVTIGENNGMFGKTHSEDAIKKQKDKSIGRYTLEWFIGRYGQDEGQKKYNERRLMLKNRQINYSFPNSFKGKSRGEMSNEAKKKLTESKIRLRTQKPMLIQDIRDGKLSVLQMAEKYGIATSSVKYHRNKLKENKL